MMFETLADLKKKYGAEIDTDTLVRTWIIEDGFMIDIVMRSSGAKDAWIYHKGYCTKMHMFGIPGMVAETYFTDLVLYQRYEYIDSYREKYMDE